MKPLNRPMFRMGGPIKEGIMDGIEEPRRSYQTGAFGTGAYTEEDYRDFLERSFVRPPPSETTIPGMLRPDVKNFFQDGMVTDQYSYENLFKPTKTVIRDGKEVQVPASIFDTAMIDTIGGKTNLFDYASAGIPGDLANRVLTGGKTAFATALKKDILSKLPKSVTQAGGGADIIDIMEEKEEDIKNPQVIEDNQTYIEKMKEGMLKRAPKDVPQDPEDIKKTAEDSELLQKLGYDRAVKRGNYKLIEAIRKGLTEGGVQGALDAAFAAGAQDPYGEASRIKQAAALKEFERKTDLEDYEKKLKLKSKFDKTQTGKGIIEKNYNFLTEVLKMDPDKATRIATKAHATIDEAIFDVQKGTGLPQVTSSILDSSGGLFYGNEYKGKASSTVDTTSLEDGWYLIDGVQFVEIEDGKVTDKSRKYEVAR